MKGWPGGIVLMLLGMAGSAQEPFFMEAATHPARGNHYSRVRVVDDRLLLQHAAGIRSFLAVQADLDAGDEATHGADVRLKYRFFQWDTGALDTWRASVLAGPSWRESGTTSVRLGVVSTLIRSRHGLNLQVDGNPAEPSDQRGQINGSYLFRLAPASYGPQTAGAWYLMVEALQTLTSDWDVESDLACGLLYEAQRWAVELAVRQDDTEVQVGGGVRYLW